MKRTAAVIVIIAASIAFMQIYPGNLPAAEKIISLPKPQTEGGKPLMQTLKLRRSGRSFSDKKLAPQQISNLLWAACGINRPGENKRTAPSAVNWQEIDIYAAMEEGLYIYDAKKHALILIVEKDLRELTGKQPFVKNAPLNLVYVADLSRMGKASPEDKQVYAAADAGFISQNVYLFCASEGLATVVRAFIDKEALSREMHLSKNQVIVLAQTLGFPK